MELFRPDIPGDVFFIDLDSLVVGPVAHMARAGKTTFLSDFYRPHNLQSSLMYLTAETRGKVWAAWHGNEERVIADYSQRRCGFNGDQNYIQDVIGADVARWQTDFPGEVCSFKVDVLKKHGGKIPPGTNVVIFHGRPRPWDTIWG